MAEQQQPTEAERGGEARISSRSPLMELQHQPQLDSPSMSPPPATQPSPAQQHQRQKEEMMPCVVALEAALLPCLPARELQAVDRSVYSSHQIDVERHAREIMEAAKKLQVFFIGLQCEEQLSREDRLRKELSFSLEDLLEVLPDEEY